MQIIQSNKDVCYERLSMKVIEEAATYGAHQGYQPVKNEPESSTLKMRVSPSSFSGPPQLERLKGRCFDKLIDDYKYVLCPFSNVTQYEQSLRWNPYSGVLGVWQEWEIINNTFNSMIMAEGDSCGKSQRTVKVFLNCSDTEDILSVSEPSTCNYHLMFSTPLVCHPHAMLVYPTVNATIRSRWDQLYTELGNEELTMQGYNKGIHELFIDVGYVMSNESKIKQVEEIAKEDSSENTEIATFEQCQEENKKLKEEIEGLKVLVELYKAKNDTEDFDFPGHHWESDDAFDD